MYADMRIEKWTTNPVPQAHKGSDMGKDEEQICTYCLLNSIPVLVSHNIVVGHLSFGGQNKAMREYYEEHKALFLPPEDGYCYEGE